MKLTPFGLRIIVRRYQYPEMTNSIYLGLRNDESGTLWDVVKWNDEVEKYLGVELTERTIMRTPSDVAVPLIDDLYIIPAPAVIGLHQWENEVSDDSE
jgi:hypothetical protein